MELTDTHAHLTSHRYGGQLEAVVQRSRGAGVGRWITIGTDTADSAEAIALSGKHEGMHCTVGVHPHEAGKVEGGYIDELRQLSSADKVCAIGEIGLDYHYDYCDRTSQKKVFEEQLTLAEEVELPVVLHCREAFDDCLNIVDGWGRDEAAVVFHCFSGDRRQAGDVLDRGYFLSFTGTVTFSNAHEAQRVARYVPLERVFLETDCPYLSPEPKRNVKPNEPALLVHIAAKMAELKRLNPVEIAEATNQNCRLFFKMD